MSAGDLVHTIVFYLFGAVAIGGALVAVISKRILRAAIGLAATLVCGAGFYILLGYDFIAGIQILVYVGGIVVLIVYAIMLTSSLEFVETRPGTMRKGLAFLASGLFFVFSVTALYQTSFAVKASAASVQPVAPALGRLLLNMGSTGYVLPFEIISLLLLAAVIGGIVIARSFRHEAAAAQSGVDRI